jgi:hypothetical protein
MAFCAGGRLSDPPAQMALCWQAGHPPAQMVISTGSKLLAGAAPASKNRFYPPGQIISGLVK